MTTKYHSQYYAYQLTKRLASDNAEKLSQSLLNATVDMNPHQVDSALFAFRSPLSRGAILADEVGLGKTIEAGLVMSQLWAERKRRILCIVPASLRKQWNRELIEKFFIDSTILESKSYNAFKKKHDANPFDQDGLVVICSYQFAKSKADEMKRVPWDLIVLDEAHRMRNVYKRKNVIAQTIREAIEYFPKLLLTATPLQNSLMELYGLVSFVDPHLFGNVESFKSQFVTRGASISTSQIDELRSRIHPICQRTLRRQVTEYVPYTNRISITQDFTPTDDEVKLYNHVSDYLQKPELIALPAGQRQLITLILRKILASSSFAISATLGKLISRLEGTLSNRQQQLENDASDLLGDDVEHTDQMQEEWSETSAEESDPHEDEESAIQLQSIKNEIAELQEYKSLAESITENAKGNALLLALQLGFEKAREINSPQKALVFTESRRTQTYLKGLLEKSGYAGQIVTFNGTNNSPESKQVYKDWLVKHEGQDCITGSRTADSRAALVEHFYDDATIMIATESAAEGINLQFCNLVVNYDLPWNPQRVEQRIGRCHRYGQKHDVVVINFINRKNEADQRVFQLLNEKFHLFDGVFGASDEVLGTLESGIDFEKQIAIIYQKCRTPEEINSAFDDLQKELEVQINARMKDTRTQLLENFDEKVREKLRDCSDKTIANVNRYERWLWWLTKTELQDSAQYDDSNYSFILNHHPQKMPTKDIPLGAYQLVTKQGDSTAHHYRFDHPLAALLLERAKSQTLEPCLLTFDHTNHEGQVALAKKYEGQSGWMRASVLKIGALETEEHVILSAFTDDNTTLDQEESSAFFSVSGSVDESVSIPDEVIKRLNDLFHTNQNHLLVENEERNLRFFNDEEGKLDRWAEDVKESLERELKEIAAEIRATKKESRMARNLDDKLVLQKRIKSLEKKRNGKRKHLFESQDEVDKQRDVLINQTQEKLKQSIEIEELFTIRWTVN